MKKKKNRFSILRTLLRTLNSDKDPEKRGNTMVYFVNLCNHFTEKEIIAMSNKLKVRFSYFSKRLLESYGLI